MNKSWQNMLCVIFSGYGQDNKCLDMTYRKQKLDMSGWFKHPKHFLHIFIVRSDKFFCCVDARLRPIFLIWKPNLHIQGRTKFSRRKRRPADHVLWAVLPENVCPIVPLQYKWLVFRHTLNLLDVTLYQLELMKGSRSTRLTVHALYNLSTSVE